MKKNTIVLFLFLVTTISAQQVVSTQGDSYSNINGSINFTIGEVIINTGTNGINDITQGFHQTNWNILGIEDNTANYEATIYPNPVEDVLNIRTNTFRNVTYTLYDILGKLILQDKLIGEETAIRVDQLDSGNYILTLSNNTQKLKTFN